MHKKSGHASAAEESFPFCSVPTRDLNGQVQRTSDYFPSFTRKARQDRGLQGAIDRSGKQGITRARIVLRPGLVLPYSKELRPLRSNVLNNMDVSGTIGAILTQKRGEIYSIPP